MAEEKTANDNAQGESDDIVKKKADTTEVTEEEAKLEYEVLESESEPGSIRNFKLRIPKQAYDNQMEEVFNELKSEVVIDGFRKGKAPLKLLKIQYGEEADRQAVDKLFPQYMDQLIKDQDIQLVSEPAIKDHEISEEGSLILQAALEVRPVIEVSRADYKGVEVKANKYEVTDDDVDRELKALQLANAVYEAKPDEASFEPDNAVVVDIEVTDDRGRKINHLCHENMFLKEPATVLAKEIIEALLGRKKGEKVEVEIARERKDQEGKVESQKDTYRIKIREIKERVLPELDDEFAKDLGDFPGLKELKDKISSDLEQQQEEKERLETLNAVYDHLLDKVKFDAPRSLVDGETARMVEADVSAWKSLGVIPQFGEEQRKDYVEKKRAEAERRVKILLLLNHIAREEKIEVDESDVNQELEKLAEPEGRKPLAIRARLEAEKRFEEFKDQLQLKKVTDFLIENVRAVYEK